MADVTVVGGGVNGITTGLLLETLGYDTILYTKERADRAFGSERSREFSSTWGAGAIAWPVMVEGDGLNNLFKNSQRYFGVMNRAASMGVRRQMHYSVSENADCRPEFREHLLSTRRMEREEEKPKRTGKNPKAYLSEIYFAEMPFYMRRMYQLYQEAGGEIKEEKISRDDIAESEGLIVNCTGYYSRELFGDNSMKALKGYLLRVKDAPLPRKGNSVASYDYDAEDEGTLYCFPRNDALVLGGSHLKGEPAPEGEWKGEEIETDTVEIDGLEIPERILEENRDILGNFSGMDIMDYELEACAGYRPYRSKGVRIEKEHLDGSEILHNYGHGGSGITLSWGSAHRIAEKTADLGVERNSPARKSLHKRIKKTFEGF